MSWEGAPAFRWKKEFRKKVYRVSCKDLGFADEKRWTKEDTYQVANAWWTAKHAELTNISPQHPHQDVFDELDRRAEIAVRTGQHDEAAELRKQIKALKALPADQLPVHAPGTLKRMEAAELLGIVIPNDLDPVAAEAIFGDERVWNDRQQRIRTVPPDSTAKSYADRFLDFHRTQTKANNKSAGRFGVIRNGMAHFVEWFGESRPMDEMSEAVVSGYYSHLMGRLATGGKRCV